MRRAARTDNNHTRIAEALRRIGASVQSLASMGAGVPDFLVGYHGRNCLLEIKDAEKPPSHRQLTVAERKWHDAWGGQVAVVETEEQAQIEVIRICCEPCRER